MVNTAATQTTAGQGPGLVTYFDRAVFTMDNPPPPVHGTVTDALAAFRDGKYRDKVERIRAITDQGRRNEQKRQTLPIYCFSGTFTYRSEECMTAHSGLAIMDLDHMKPDALLAARHRLTNDPNVFALFLSPSGDGLKVLFRIPPDIADHRRHYVALLDYLGITEADKRTKDPSRACFVSWDPDLYLNVNADVFTAPLAPEPTSDKGLAQTVQDLPLGVLSDIYREAQARVMPKVERSASLLDKMLEQVEPVDFRELAGLVREEDKLRGKHYAVHAVEQVLAIAQRNGWGLCKNAAFIYLFNGAYWEVLDADELQGFLGRAAERMGVDFNEARWYGFKDQLYRQFLTAAHLPQPEPDRNVTLVNLRNGTFEITGSHHRLRLPDPADFLKYQLPFDYDPKATAPRFRAYLDRVLPDKSSQAVVAEFLGYVFTKNLKMEKVLLLHGSGANGKSVLFDIVTAMLGGGSNVSHYSLQNLTDQNGYYRAMIANKLVNYASEINGKAIGCDTFKQLASNEPVEARLPYGRPFTVTDYAKFIFNANELPRDIEATLAFHRRFLIVPFNERIPEAEQDKGLAGKVINSELSGVFNWVLDGLRRLLNTQRFTHSDAVEQAQADYRRRSDSVLSFIDEHGLRPSPTANRPLKDLFREYRTACTEAGSRPCSQATFSARLLGAGFTIDRRGPGRIVWVETDEHAEENVF
jgi:putative DNA primase/helicase